MKLFSQTKYLILSLLLLLLTACGEGSNSGFPTADCGGEDNLCVSEFTITPNKAAILIDGLQNYQAIATLTDGSELDITDHVTWAVDNETIATIAIDGNTVVATGIADGVAVITGKYRGMNASAQLSVGAITFSIIPSLTTILTDMQQNYQAFAVFPNGVQVEVTEQVSWASDNSAIATINVVDNLVTASGLSEGLATISASYNGKAIYAQLNVINSTAETLLISPASAVMPLGTAKQYSAFLTTTSGEVIDVSTTVNWQITDETIATIDATARLTATEVGSTEITANIVHSNNTLTASSALMVNNAQLDTIAISPVDGIYPVGKIGVYRANAHYADGSVIDVTRETTWQVVDTNIGTIVESGIFAGDSVALSPGKTTISARFQAQTSQTNVEVTAAKTIKLSISPIDASTPVGTQLAYQGFALYSDGTKRNITVLAAWSSSESSVAAIGFTGALSGITNALDIGTTNISVNYDGLTASTPLTVTNAVVTNLQVSPLNPSVPVGIEGQFTAIAYYSDNTTVDVTHNANWTVDDYSIAAVIPNGEFSGYAKALNEGSNQLTASFSGQSANTSITVTAATLSSLSLSPSTAEIPAGTTQQYQLFGLFSDGTNHDLTEFSSFQTSDNAAVSIDSNGLAIAHNDDANPITVTASYRGMQATASLVVTAGLLEYIEVTPSEISIPVGHKGQLYARAFYSDGSNADITYLATWSLDDGDIASVDNTNTDAGEVLGISQGVVTVTASYLGTTATTNVLITAAVLESVSITPVAKTIAAGLTQQYTLTAEFSDKTSSDVTKSSAWISSDPTTASIDNLGLATSYWEGKITITGTYQGISAVATLTITGAELLNIQVTPADPKEPIGTEGRFTATAFYTDGFAADVTSNATWSSLDDGIVHITTSGIAGGRASADKVGISVITAKFAGKTDSTTATVTEAVLESLVISPPSAEVPQGTNFQYRVDGIYSDKVIKDLTHSATWLTGDINIATIDTTGLAMGENQGDTSITASVDGMSTMATIKVTSTGIDHLEVSPSSWQLPLGTSTKLIAYAFDGAGIKTDISNDADWKVLATGTDNIHVDNSVTNGGFVSSIAIGNGTVEVSYAGLAATAEIDVTDATVDTLTISPQNTEINMPGNQQYTAMATLTDTTVVDYTKQVYWHTSDKTVATIDAAHQDTLGLASAVSEGTTTIKASFGPIFTETNLTVTLLGGGVDSIQIHPHVNHLTVGEKVQLTCSLIHLDSTLSDCNDDVVWTMADDSIAHVEPTGSTGGLITGLKADTTRVFATYQGITSSNLDGQITVTEPVLESITVNPSTQTLAREQAFTYSATAHYSDGDDKDISNSVTWSVSKPNIATVNNHGRVIGKVVGDTQVTARLNDISGQASLTIDNRTYLSAEFIPDPSSLTVGDIIDITCMVTYGFPPSGTDPVVVDMTEQAAWQFKYSIDDIGNLSNSPGSKGHFEATKAGSNVISCMLPQSNGSFIAPNIRITVTN
ncbi:beta strand repeat-containing protein [Colwellia psychrerythraea]|uniref:Ig domain protein group 2 domain protein n=1 Tax=Colwellia psychrerythraea TaxID=28229 RepID=A0A099L3Y4_COLPS|nr:Ig-like domain-containing protein [Colwellia psychrerythraea]KGJ97654.1 Ig domain protein group 2 domain protein [Colwellia psychrerythraea]